MCYIPLTVKCQTLSDIEFIIKITRRCRDNVRLIHFIFSYQKEPTTDEQKRLLGIGKEFAASSVPTTS